MATSANQQHLEKQYLDSIINTVCLYILSQSRTTNAADAVSSAFFFLEGLYTLSPAVMCDYMHNRYGTMVKQVVLAKVLQEAVRKTGVQAEERSYIQDTGPLPKTYELNIAGVLNGREPTE